MRTRILVAAAISLVATAAYADTVSASILVAWLGPAISTAIVAIIGWLLGLVGVIISRYAQKIGINISDDMWAIVERTAEHWAAQWWASEEAWLATATIKIGDRRVAYWANLALKDIPDIAKKLGLTPQKMQEYIVAALGKLQVSATSVTVPAVNPTPAAAR